MKAFILACAAAIVIAVVGGVALNSVPDSAEKAFTSSDRRAPGRIGPVPLINLAPPKGRARRGCVCALFYFANAQRVQLRVVSDGT